MQWPVRQDNFFDKPSQERRQEMKSSAQTNHIFTGQRRPHARTYIHTHRCAGMYIKGSSVTKWVTPIKQQGCCIAALWHNPLQSRCLRVTTETLNPILRKYRVQGFVVTIRRCDEGVLFKTVPKGRELRERSHRIYLDTRLCLLSSSADDPADLLTSFTERLESGAIEQVATSTSYLTVSHLKGKFNQNYFSTHHYVNGGSCDHSGVSRRERIRPNAFTMEACGRYELQNALMQLRIHVSSRKYGEF